MKKATTLFVIFLLLFVLDASAANLYWYGNSSTNFSTAANWSTSSASYVASGSVPGTSDVANFGNYTGMTNANCALSANISVQGMQMSSGYTGTFTQSTYSITIGTSGATLSGGTFSGGSATIVSNGAFTISGTAFTSTSGQFSCVANFTYSSGSFTHNSGKVKFTTSCTITGSVTFKQLEFAPSGNSSFTIASGTTLTVDSTLTVSGSSGSSINTGSIDAKGDITISNSSNNIGGGTGTITIKGTGNQAFTGSTTAGAGRTCNIVINKSSGTLTLSNYITVIGNWTHTNGTLDPGSSTVYFFGTKTISGSHTLNNVILHGSGNATFTISSGTTLTVLETLTIANGSNGVSINTGTIEAQGDVTVTNSSTSSGGSGEIKFTGDSIQTFTGNGTAGQGRLPKITINKGSTGYLTLASVISVANTWTYTAGEVKPGSSVVVFYGTFNVDAQGSTAAMSFYDVTVGSGTVTLAGNLDADRNLTINTSTTLSAGSYTINVGGSFTNNGTWTYSTSTVVFDGTGYRQITGTASTTVQFYNVTFNKTAQSLNLARPVKVNNAMVLTKGRIKASTTNYLEIADNATCTGGGIGAFVHGAMRKTGNDAFTFPLGDTTLTDSAAFHPLAMTAPSSTTDQFEVIYYPVVSTAGTALASTLESVSTCQYWSFDRKSGSSTPTVSISWNSNCDNGAYNEMRVALWNGTLWSDLGQASVTVSGTKTGTLAASSATSFTANPAHITVGYALVNKTYATLSKTPGGGYYTTDGSVLYFGFAEEYNDANSKLSFSVRKLSNDASVSLLGSSANTPANTYGYNRFKIDLYDNTNTPLASGYYMLEVTNDKNEKWYLRFKI